MCLWVSMVLGWTLYNKEEILQMIVFNCKKCECTKMSIINRNEVKGQTTMGRAVLTVLDLYYICNQCSHEGMIRIMQTGDGYRMEIRE